MDRRIFISALATLPFMASARAGVPWSAKFVSGAFDGKTYQAGLHIILGKGWKTYWRNPGDAGIPPNIKSVGENLAEMTVDFPLPTRTRDESGVSLAYHDEVVFLLNLKPKDAARPLDVELSSFFGVCEQVCTPAKFDGALILTSSSAAADADLIAQWRRRVPKLGHIVKSAKVEDKFLVLDLNQSVNDVFVEGPENYYFRGPDFKREAGKAYAIIDGLQKQDDLKGANLRITVDIKGQGLEQHIAVT